MSWIDWLRQLWIDANPALYMQPPQQPVLRRLNDDQAELSWQGPPFLFDRRSQTITRAGQVIANYSAIKAIVISVSRYENEEWGVSLELGFFKHVFIGAAPDQVDVSIMAAHISTLTGKRVLA